MPRQGVDINIVIRLKTVHIIASSLVVVNPELLDIVIFLKYKGVILENKKKEARTMQRQIYLLTLKVPPPFDGYFPKVEVEQMACIIRDGVEAKSCSFMGAVPFEVRVEQDGKVASASGQMRGYLAEEIDKILGEPIPQT